MMKTQFGTQFGHHVIYKMFTMVSDYGILDFEATIYIIQSRV